MQQKYSIDIPGLNTLLHPERMTHIVDIGANPINPTPYDALIRNKVACVWGFEPQEAAFTELQKMQTPHLTFLKYAIGDAGIHDLRVCKGSAFTSLLEPNKAFCNYIDHFHIKMQVEQRIPVQTRRLDDVCELPAIDLVKIDIQGGEVTAFENAQRTLQNAVAVISEVAFIPLYEDQPLLDAQMREMRKNGFKLHKFMPHTSVPLRGQLQNKLGVDPLRNQLTDADAVFLRDVSSDTDLDDEGLKHMALLAAGAFDSLDVCLRCLEILMARKKIDPDAVNAWVDALRA